MTDDEVIEKLTKIIRDILDDENIVVTPSTIAEDVKDWDSANHINIVVAAESRFKVKFNNAEIERLRNVGDFVGVIQKKLAGKELGKSA
jgi:acyl carrier protein